MTWLKPLVNRHKQQLSLLIDAPRSTRRFAEPWGAQGLRALLPSPPPESLLVVSKQNLDPFGMDGPSAITGETGSIPPSGLRGVQGFLRVNTRMACVVGSSSGLSRMSALAPTTWDHRRISLCGDLRATSAHAAYLLGWETQWDGTLKISQGGRISPAPDCLHRRQNSFITPCVSPRYYFIY